MFHFHLKIQVRHGEFEETRTMTEPLDPCKAKRLLIYRFGRKYEQKKIHFSRFRVWALRKGTGDTKREVEHCFRQEREEHQRHCFQTLGAARRREEEHERDSWRWHSWFWSVSTEGVMIHRRIVERFEKNTYSLIFLFTRITRGSSTIIIMIFLRSVSSTFSRWITAPGVRRAASPSKPVFFKRKTFFYGNAGFDPRSDRAKKRTERKASWSIK